MQRLETLPRPQCSASSPAMQRKPFCEDLGEKNTARKKENSCLLTPHSFSVTLFTLGFRLFF
jgi:hypothetical protein